MKDPEEWKTGDEPMTGAQRSYLRPLGRSARADGGGADESPGGEADRRITAEDRGAAGA